VGFGFLHAPSVDFFAAGAEGGVFQVVRGYARSGRPCYWIPACAGMTGGVGIGGVVVVGIASLDPPYETTKQTTPGGGL